MFGIGIPPTKFEPRLISVGLNKDFSSTIHFKNPFKENINVNITLEAQVIFLCLLKWVELLKGRVLLSKC